MSVMQQNLVILKNEELIYNDHIPLWWEQSDAFICDSMDEFHCVQTVIHKIQFWDLFLTKA